MKKFRIAVLILLIAIAAPFALHRRAWALHHFTASKAMDSGFDAPLRIISPVSGEKLEQRYVVVQYQPISSVSSSTPGYELSLDGRDPVQTTETNYTFNGLKPGNHNVIVQAIDSKGTPISGTHSEVRFTVSEAAAAASTASTASSSLPTLPQPLASDLPNGNGSLPLLSIIGFGILVGGVISALRTRPAHK